MATSDMRALLASLQDAAFFGVSGHPLSGGFRSPSLASPPATFLRTSGSLFQSKTTSAKKALIQSPLQRSEIPLRPLFCPSSFCRKTRLRLAHRTQFLLTAIVLPIIVMPDV
ncbi:MAG: hypothetical protein ACO1TE_13660 [Prosthecobacter sp.]